MQRDQSALRPTVRLNLLSELTALVSETAVGAITTTKRSAQTSLISDDGQTTIVGGLIQDNNNAIQSRVPGLGNVPLFGWLFKQTLTRKRETNLLIFLTPHLVDTPDDARRITDSFSQTFTITRKARAHSGLSTSYVHNLLQSQSASIWYRNTHFREGDNKNLDIYIEKILTYSTSKFIMPVNSSST
jgi:type II secretory pathway component GspD/PulD (secretin)